MQYTIAVFKSRYATLNFANLLRAHNIPSAIINTPQNLGRACGISVKFLSDFLPRVKQLFLDGKTSTSFVGFYAYKSIF